MPLTGGCSTEYINTIIQDTNPCCILTDQANSWSFNQMHLSIPLLDIQRVLQTDQQICVLPEIPSDSIAYILYTSGTTGKPKGVYQNHRNVLHHSHIYIENLSIGNEDRLLLLASYAFDASVMDIFGALLSGAALYVYDIKKKSGINGLVRFINTYAITIYHSTPIVFRLLTNTVTPYQQFNKVRVVIMGGEVCNADIITLYNNHFSDMCCLINGYGPTESTISLQFYYKKCGPYQSALPIGFPVNGISVRICDEKGRDVMQGDTGELYLQSRYLALGYWNQSDKTNASFMTHPSDSDMRIYKTGDLVYEDDNGCVHYRGRTDFQVKIQGKKANLSVIEKTIEQYPEIVQCVVSLQTDSNYMNYLVAWYTARDGCSIEKKVLLRFLRGKLSEHEIPNQLFHIQQFKLLANGKVDRKFLSSQAIDVQGPRTPFHSKDSLSQVLEVWRDVLKDPSVELEDDFFESGGNSLIAIKVEIATQSILYKISVSDIYKHRTLENILRYRYIPDIGGTPKSKADQKKPAATVSPAVLAFEETHKGKPLTPFNDIFYKSCFFNSFFPILEGYGIGILPVLINDIPVWSATDSIQRDKRFFTTPTYQWMDYVSRYSFSELLDRMNIQITVHSGVENLDEELDNAASQGHPVILWFDSFYEPNRKDTFNKLHWSHSLLITGADKKSKHRIVIEHRHKDNLSYQYQTMSNSIVRACHTGFLQHFSGEPEYARIEFNLDQVNCRDELIPNVYSEFFAMLNTEEENIIKKIQDFSDNILSCVIFDKSENTQQTILNELNHICEVKKADAYKYMRLFLSDQFIPDIQHNFDQWNIIRLKYAREIMSGSLSDLWKKSLLAEMQGMMQNELTFMHRIINVAKNGFPQ